MAKANVGGTCGTSRLINPAAAQATAQAFGLFSHNTTKAHMYFARIMEHVITAAEQLEGLEVPVFAVVAVEDNVVAEADNEVEGTRVPWMHAEFLALQRAIEALGIRYLSKASIYVNLEPCAFCAAAMEKARIGEIFFGAYDPKCGAIEHNARIFDHSLIKPTIIGGIQEGRCSQLISDFFKKLR